MVSRLLCKLVEPSNSCNLKAEAKGFCSVRFDFICNCKLYREHRVVGNTLAHGADYPSSLPVSS